MSSLSEAEKQKLLLQQEIAKLSGMLHISKHLLTNQEPYPATRALPLIPALIIHMPEELVRQLAPVLTGGEASEAMYSLLAPSTGAGSRRPARLAI